MNPNADTAQQKPAPEDKSKSDAKEPAPEDKSKSDAKEPAPEDKSKSDAKAQAKVDLKPGAKSESKDDLKSVPMPELQTKLGSTPDGLTQDEAQKRLTQYGPNEIPEKKTNVFLKFLTYFWGPIPWMIEGAVILSGVLKHWLDFFIILFLLFSNAVVGFWEERQAGNAIAALKATLATKAKAKRDGKWADPKASELVPGDVIRLRLGDVVPADARLLAGDPVQVDQSALTGESLPVTVKPGGAVFSGSIIRKGEIDAMVYATGANTYFGKTVQLVEEAHTVSHFQKSVLKIGNYLIVLAAVLVAVIVTVSLFRHNPFLNTLQFALVLLVAAIPVAMPTVLSVTMAVGARLLAKKQVVVTRLAAIEELAGVDILCSDKTGTLTQNKLTLGDPFTVNNIPGDQVILWAALASRAEDKDTIDLAVIGGVKDDKALKSYQVLHFQPFDPVHKRTEATVKGSDGKQFFVAKGAPQVILEMATNKDEVKSAVEKAVNDFAGRGFRSLGVARADEEGKWQFAGVLPMSDPPREQAKATIASAEQMGVKVKMVTGDQLAIAREMAKELGMGTNILDATTLQDKKQQDSSQASEAIEKADGYAQVFPQDKFHIIQVLQKRGHFVGMTGDGVNDAPALKQANCGIAVSGATDAARAAASIVLLAPGLSVIIDAIKEARRIVQRMNSYAIYRIAETLRVLLFMVAAILVFNFYPVTAVMIVMIAVLNDGAIISIAYDNVLFKDQPEAWDMRLVLGIATVLGLVGPVAAFGLFYLGDKVFHLGHPQLQTLMYLMLSVAGHLTIFLTRTRGPLWSIRPAKILWIAVLGTQTLATLIAVYGLFMTPLGWKLAGLVWAYALVWALLTDRVKLLGYHFLDHSKADAPKQDVKAAAPTSEPKADAPKPEGKAEESKTDDKGDQPKPEPKADAPKPEDKADEPKPDDKGDQPKPEPKADAPKPEGKADEPKPDDKGDQPKPEPKADAPKPEDKADVPKPDDKGDQPKSEPKADAPKPEGKAEESKTDDKADQPKSEPKPDAPKPQGEADKSKPDDKGDQPKPEPKADAPKPQGKAEEPKPDDKADQPKSEPKADAPKPEGKADESKPDDKADQPKPEGKVEPKPDDKDKTDSDVTPRLVKRVHELYEELGHEEVQAVEDWENAKTRDSENESPNSK